MSKLKIVLFIISIVAVIIIGVFIVLSIPACFAAQILVRNLPAISETSATASEDGFGKVPGEAGRLRFPGTDIDGPVMVAGDNEYFLRRDEQGNEDIWGCYFLDFECTPDSQNLIVYGHSLEDEPDGQRFSQLKRLNDAGFAAENKRIFLTVRGTEYEFEIFSHGLVHADNDSIVISANPTDTEMRDIISGAIERSAHDYSADVSEKDKLLTLATCMADAEQRFVVVAKQVR